MTITIEEDLLERAREVLGVRTKAETIRQSLLEVVRRKRLANALGHQGTIDLGIDREGLEQLREEG